MSSLERNALLSQVQSLLAKKDFSREDSARAESLLALADRTGPQAMELRRAAVAQAELEMGIRTADNSGAGEVESEFRQYLRHGQKPLLSDKTRMEMAGAVRQTRSQSVGSGTGGGYIVPASFRTDLEIALKAYDGLFSVCGQWLSQTGTSLTIPILNDTVSAAVIIPENGLITEEDITTFDGIAFGLVPTYKSLVIVSTELVQDSYFDISTVLAAAFGVRFARAIGRNLVAALLAGADVGVTAGSSSVVAASELADVMAALDSAYWAAATWCMNKNTLISLMKQGMVTDPAGQAITMWTTGPLRLFDKPIVICPSMPDIGAATTPISFGDHSKVLRREVANSLQVKVLSEKYALNAQQGFIAYWRVDQAFLKPSPQGSPATSQSPCMLIQCAAS